MKPNDIKSASYAKYSVDFDAKDADFKIGDVFAVKKLMKRFMQTNCKKQMKQNLELK